MSALVDHLSRYAEYHRNGRNVATHMVGIPLIVLAVEILLSRPHWTAGPMIWSPVVPAAAVATIFYVSLDVAMGLVMAVLLSIGAWIGFHAAEATTAVWLGAGVGAFVLGWIIQFIGHGFEGRKPAFLDDITGLVIGPLFIVAEVAFFIGLRKKLKGMIEDALPR